MEPQRQYLQDPIAIVGLACRLPGNSNSPVELWNFLEKGGVARNEAPKSRFNLSTHHDGSKKVKTMRSPGGMFLENINPEDFDAQFFGIRSRDAAAMDPQQRQLLEVVYECLENAGISLEALDGQDFGCFVGSYAVDYSDMHARDPEDRPSGITVGVGRAILSNRISHFLNIKGPSFTVDTACSGSLVALDAACHYLNTGEVGGAIVAASNLYLGPEHVMDEAVKNVSSPSGRCHTFDEKADGYIKAEAVNAVILKRLDDAIRDGDPIRAIIRGSATNSDGRTPGIAMPSAEAQTAVIRAAYKHAGIIELSSTSYIECHGTGTATGDPIEVMGVSSLFAGSLTGREQPLIIGSIKSNIGHSEPAAGISGLLKAVLALERGFIPGNPTFTTPNPRIDFNGLTVRVLKTTTPWPVVPFRRAGVNSFGYGGSNAHVILDEAKTSNAGPSHVSSFTTDYDDIWSEEESTRPYLLVFSANDETSLKAYSQTICKHLINPSVSIKLPDLSYTLSERRSRHFHRAFVVTNNTNLHDGDFVFGKKKPSVPRVGFVFTGQGAHWSQMGKALIETFPVAKSLIRHLDDVLHALNDETSWYLMDELVESRSPEQLRLPEFSQPLATALQLALSAVLKSWGISPLRVVGHSSGEIAAASAAGFITSEEAIKIAYFRGLACSHDRTLSDNALNFRKDSSRSITLSERKLPPDHDSPREHSPKEWSLLEDKMPSEKDIFIYENVASEPPKIPDDQTPSSTLGYPAQPLLGMLAVGLGPDHVQQYLCAVEDLVQIACFNSPCSVTLSGDRPALEKLKLQLQEHGHFARLLQVDYAYHSYYMTDAADRYEFLLKQDCAPPYQGREDVLMFSSVTGRCLDRPCDVDYWKTNMTSPVRFGEAIRQMISGPDSVDFLVEIGPSGALAGPIKQVLSSLSEQAADVQYCTALSRGNGSIKSMFDVAGRLFVCGGSVGLASVNQVHDVQSPKPAVIVDLPNYCWNHSIKYWHESDASRDWRFRKFPHHDLIGTKILGTPWSAPSWKKTLRVDKLHWLKDHRMGEEIVFPAAAFIAMAVEAIYQATQAFDYLEPSAFAEKYRYRLRNVTFPKALVLDERSNGQKVTLVLAQQQNSWHEFKISSSSTTDTWNEHCRGTIRLERDPKRVAGESDLAPMKHVVPAHLWYKITRKAGFSFGPKFQKLLEIEGLSGMRNSRATLSLSEPREEYPQSHYPMHPVSIDACFQSVISSLWQGTRSNVNAVLIPAIIDNLVINPVLARPNVGISVSSTAYVGVGRSKQAKNYMSNASVYNPNNGNLLLQFSGLRYHELNLQKDQDRQHSYSQLLWKPDITYLTQDEFLELPAKKAMHHKDSASAQLRQIIDLILHKRPQSLVMEVNMNPDNPTSIWLEVDHALTKAASDRFSFIATDSSTLLNVQSKFGTSGDIEFLLLDMAQPIIEIPSIEEQVDLIIVNMKPMPDLALMTITQNLRGQLRDGGYLVVIEDHAPSYSSESEDMVFVNEIQPEQSAQMANVLQTHDFTSRMNLQLKSQTIHLAQGNFKNTHTTDARRRIHLAHLSTSTPLMSTVKESLTYVGWRIEDDFFPFPYLPPRSIILVLDDLSSPLLNNVGDDQWQALKYLTSIESKILWVTAGSQFQVTNPDTAPIHGLAMTMRSEDPMLSLTTLDVECGSSHTTFIAIDRILRYLEHSNYNSPIESEFVERQGIMYVPRILPDDKINQLDSDERQGTQPQVRSLHESETCIGLRCERLGTLDSLQYAEKSEKELPIGDNLVEVEIFAAGVNFKDVAVTMGIVPANEHLLGLEGAGVIRRVGSSVKALTVGQRVLIYVPGTFANRVQVTPQRVHVLPDTMSFEDAATMPSVYLAAIYCLLHIANMQKNQRVLIHSASGGVGIAAIHLCQYSGAEIFATVGNEEKRQFLTDTFGILPDHIFSSRSSDFSSQIMDATDGNGVDIILNSLTGDLLDESWRCIADGGTMLEIGKKDILARNTLSMEPFNRNASYHGVDMSHNQISEYLIARLLSEMMDLVAQGHIKPISPVTLFPFEDVVSALRYFRAGTHIGKVVIANTSHENISVPVRPAPREVKLRTEASYLIVGGLRGICGSLAIYLARLGAKHLVILCRSGYADAKSQVVLANIAAEGCQVNLFTGDVTNLEVVQKVFKEATLPIRGLIQGAMVLRDKIYVSMSAQEFRECISSKVQGTWNLHKASLEQEESLDFFTMLSSTSGIIGNKGQANYAAANVFLDNFASYRRGLVLPASSVDLGVVEDVGVVAERSELQSHFDTDSWIPIDEAHLLQILGFSILQQTSTINESSASQLITGIPTPIPITSPLLRDIRFSPLAFKDSTTRSSKANTDEANGTKAFFTLLNANADTPALLTAALEIVSAQCTTSLRLSEPIEPAKSLSSYGLDSLAAVEFRNWARTDFGVDLTTLEIMGAASLLALCAKIVEKVAVKQLEGKELA